MRPWHGITLGCVFIAIAAIATLVHGASHPLLVIGAMLATFVLGIAILIADHYG